MTGRPTLTDDAIAAMLRARAASPVPSGLDAAIGEQVEGVPRTGTDCRARGGVRIGRTTALLAAAMLLLVSAGAILVAGGRPRSTVTPTARAVIVASASPTASMTVGLIDDPCRELDDLATASGLVAGLGPVAQPVPSPMANGPILVATATSADGMRPGRLLRIDTSDPAAPSELLTWTPDWLVRGLAASPSGSLVALGLYHAIPTSTPTCNDVLVLAADGSSFLRPFDAQLGEHFTHPSWSADGSRLYAIRSDEKPNAPADNGSLVAWDVGTGEIVDLGTPCEPCRLVGYTVRSNDGRRIAVPYVDGSGSSQDGSIDVAIFDAAEQWHLVPASSDELYSGLIGWHDDNHIQVMDHPSEQFLIDVDTGASLPLTCEPLTFGGNPPGTCEAVSPDGTRSAVVGLERAPDAQLGDPLGTDFVDVTTIATGKRARIESPETVMFDTWLEVGWSPDSRWLVLETWSSYADQHTLRVAPADGSAAPQLILDGLTRGAIGRDLWAWLPATP